MLSGIELVRTWHDAVNSGDVDCLADLVSNDVEIGGPRGSTYGSDLLIDWVERTGIRMIPVDWYQRETTVVVCEQASWPVDDGSPDVPVEVATAFTVHENRIARVVRYPSLADALAASGLSENDKVSV